MCTWHFINDFSFLYNNGDTNHPVLVGKFWQWIIVDIIIYLTRSMYMYVYINLMCNYSYCNGIAPLCC